MKNIIDAIIWLIVLAAVVALATALMGPAVSDFLSEIATDKAELERARGERAIMEAAADAVRADTRQTQAMVVLGTLIILSELGVLVFVAYVFLVMARRTYE